MDDFIKWDQTFSVDVKLIDAQHKKLFAMLNKLYGVANRSENEDEPLENIILDLAAYVDFHFKTEEKYMKEFGCENDEHIRQHQFYEEKIKEFNEKYQKGEEGVGVEIMNFLKDWISSHIKIKDKEYTGCFHDHGLL